MISVIDTDCIHYFHYLVLLHKTYHKITKCCFLIISLALCRSLILTIVFFVVIYKKQ